MPTIPGSLRSTARRVPGDPALAFGDLAYTFVASCGMRAGGRFLHVAPLYHAAELGIMLIPGTMIGARHVILPRFDPATVPGTLESERITMFFGVPTMYQFLLRLPDLADRDLSCWRTGLFGAAPMPASAVERLVTALPQVSFLQLCGQTEGGPGGVYCDAEQVKARPDASGRQALPFTEARVTDPEGHDIGPGGVGELLLRGESVMKGYWNKPAETAEALRSGWLHTGDLARVDADGYLTLVDRLKDMIITGGHNVYSIEVESIVAVITPRDGTTITLNDVRAFLHDRLTGYKIPHHVTTGAIPRKEPEEYRPLPVVLAVRDFLALFEHVCFGFVVGNFCWRRGLLAILGIMVGILVVGVLVLGVAVGTGCHGCECCLQVAGTQTSSPRRYRQLSDGDRAAC